MKTTPITVVLIFILLFTSFSAHSQKTKLSIYDSLGTMPPFKYYFINGTAFTPDNIDKKHITIMIYFKNDCPYCNRQATIISDNIKDFNNVDFIFITRDDTTDINTFATTHKLQNNPRILFLQDKEKTYYNYCTAQYTPSIHIYNKRKELLYYTQGIMKKDEMLKYQ